MGKRAGPLTQRAEKMQCQKPRPPTLKTGHPESSRGLRPSHPPISVLHPRGNSVARLSSKGDFRGKLNDSRARAEIKLRAQRRLEWRPRRTQADGHGTGTACQRCSRELGGAQRSIVYAVEGVVRLKNELCFDALSDVYVLSDSRIQRNEVGKVEGVPAASRRTIGAAVAVRI